jgi:hypothetical protein
MNLLYENLMALNSRGQHQLSDDYEESPECDDLFKCDTCGIYTYQNMGAFIIPTHWECKECTKTINQNPKP